MEKTNETLHQMALDGVVFRGPVVAREDATFGRVVSVEAARSFEDKVAETVIREGFIGPQTTKFLRKKTGLPARRLAELLGVTDRTLRRWDSGEVTIPRTSWFAIAALVRDRIQGLDLTQTLLQNACSSPRDVTVLNVA